MPEVSINAPRPGQQFGAVRPPGAKRFTLDGDPKLESHLTDVCATALSGVRKIVGRYRLEALLLGGGYGRGEGGVLKTPAGDQPYNDLEFYVCLRGNRFLNRRRFEGRLARLAEAMTPSARVDVEFHIISLAHLRRSGPSMFYYDLVVGHHRLWGEAHCLHDCDHHRDPRWLPLAEATRLLMNRGTGLLFAREKLLARSPLTHEDSDFIGRNIAKAQLAIGDAVLTTLGQYHWSCRERYNRLTALPATKDMPRLEEVRQYHSLGVEFKLRPRKSVLPAELLRGRYERVSTLMLPVWLWVESKRLGTEFNSARQYVESTTNKCPETDSWRNRLFNTLIFGRTAFSSPTSERHPRERILNALPILLWDNEDWETRVSAALKNGFEKPPRALAGTPMEVYRSIWERVR